GRRQQEEAERSARGPPGPPRAPHVSVLADHHVGSLDHRVGRVAGLELELGHRLVGDGRGDDGAAPHVDLDVGGGRAAGDLSHLALDDVPRAELHAGRSFPPRDRGNQSEPPAPRARSSTWPTTRPPESLACRCTSASRGVKIPRCPVEKNPSASMVSSAKAKRALASSWRSGVCGRSSRLSRTWRARPSTSRWAPAQRTDPATAEGLSATGGLEPEARQDGAALLAHE